MKETTKAKFLFLIKIIESKQEIFYLKVNEFYQLKMNNLSANKGGWQFNDFFRCCRCFQAKFSRRIKTEKKIGTI